VGRVVVQKQVAEQSMVEVRRHTPGGVVQARFQRRAQASPAAVGGGTEAAGEARGRPDVAEWSDFFVRGGRLRGKNTHGNHAELRLCAHHPTRSSGASLNMNILSHCTLVHEPLVRRFGRLSAHVTGGREAGITLVEIMVLVVVIGGLATLAIPAFAKVRESSENTVIASDLRGFASAFGQYAVETGGWPAVRTGGFPPEMVGRIKPSSWAKPLPGGGFYGFGGKTAGLTAVTLNNTAFSDERLVALDRVLDDGDVSTGRFRRYDGLIIYTVQTATP